MQYGMGWAPDKSRVNAIVYANNLANGAS